MQTFRSAFTLIELLVVITIVVVLLALLAPAMDQAIYQAELAVCGANQKSIGNGVMLYAMENQRRYPERKGLASTRPSLLAKATGPTFDDRPILKPYLSINGSMGCPLNEAVDLETTAPGAWVYGSQQVWYGWRYDKLEGMMKVGDRFDWGGNRFSVLASDWVSLGIESQLIFAYGSHPDDKAVMHPYVRQNAGTAAQNDTLSMYRIDGTPKRSPIDRNILFDDVSVSRYLGTAWNEHELSTGQMVWVPEQSTTPNSWGYISHLPPTR